MASHAPSTSAVDSKEKMDATVQAFNMLAQGKRNLICGEVPTAVTQFQEACKLLAEHYGEMAKECAEAYYCYGSALLDLARMENGVLGNALEGDDGAESEANKEETDDNLTEDERESLRKQVYDAMGEDEAKKTEEKEMEKGQEIKKDKNTDQDSEAEAKSENKQDAQNTDQDSLAEVSKEKKKDTNMETESVETDPVEELSKTKDKENENSSSETQTLSANGNKMSGECGQTEQGTAEQVATDMKPDEAEVRSSSSEPSLQDNKPAETDTAQNTVDDKTCASTDKDNVEDQIETAGGDCTQNVKDSKAEERKAINDANRDTNEEVGSKGRLKTTSRDLKEGSKEEPGDAKDKEESNRNSQQIEEMEIEVKKEECLEKEGGKKDNETTCEDKENEDKTSEDKENEEEDVEDDGDDENQAEEAEGDDIEKEDPDDVPNLQLAWEMLDLAKVIYLKDPTGENQLKAAQAYLKLGEVSLETESYEQAVEDLQACLKIQKDNLESCDRAIAETHYQLGLASQLNKQYDAAISNFHAAVKCLESKIESLKVVVETKSAKGPSDFIDPAEKAEKEIKDIEEILPEIRNKIEDAQEEMKNMDSLKSLAKEAMGELFASEGAQQEGFSTSSAKQITEEKKPVSDISHLIRKKRKPEDEESEAAAENKKIRQERGGGDAKGSPCDQNGHEQKPAETTTTTTEVEPMTTG
ncbi:hypothetical protein C0Q70_17220 [Pomacea canaliculata]|uniref:Tetratricopeptide SHNi-TPR domain-containing protein n=1 Tax=Pomacea canaliculata TaxID=400727 RepID=A0A2T7NRY6_POMCA|nr:hypothetical protein C0Q70_17220 [Pomacea canaliculata]